jgi:hypothetical protein
VDDEPYTLIMDRRVVTIHQPHFLPWLGYFNKLAWADEFIALDDVQFRRRYFQNRTLLKSTQGKAIWFTVPVRARRHDLLKDVTIAERTWSARFERTLWHLYRRAPFFHVVNQSLIDAARGTNDRLLETNLLLLTTVLKLLGLCDLAISLSSSYSRDLQGEDRIVELCLHVGATHYLFGEGGGARRHNPDEFGAAGIVPLFQDFRRTHLPYPQQFGSFVPNLSVVDALYNIGPAATAALIRSPWMPPDWNTSPASTTSHAPQKRKTRSGKD